MTGDDTTGGEMGEQRPTGAGFSAGQGVWEPMQKGGEFDTEQTGHMPLPNLTDFGARRHSEGYDPLAAPGRGVPPGEHQWAPEEPVAQPDPEGVPSQDDGAGAGQDGSGREGTGQQDGAARDTGRESEAERSDAHLEHPLASYVLRVNGADRPVADAWLGESLLYVLRERLGLAGAKDGCEQGECGACSVQVDGRLVAACMVPAATAAGCEVRTVEGLPTDGEPSDVQRALAESGAVQCGYCVPGLAMAVHDLLSGNHNPTELETRQALCGNLCRCTGYRGVLAAVREVITSRDAAEAAEAAARDGEGVYIPHQAGPANGAPGPHDPNMTNGGGATS